MRKTWRIRYIIDSGAILENGTMDLRGATVNVSNVPSKVDGINEKFRDRCRLIDIHLDFDGYTQIEDAYTRGVELMTDFLSRLTLLAYHPAQSMFISVTPFPVSKGEKFDLLLINARIERASSIATIKDIEQFNSIQENSNYFSSINHLRMSQISENPEERYMSYYRALEQIAEQEATETIRSRCKECNVEYDSGRKATARYIGTMLKEYGISNVQRKKHEKMRGKIAHGSFKRDYRFANDLMKLIVELEPIAFAIVAKKTKITMRCGNSVILNFPTTKYSLMRNKKGDFVLNLAGGVQALFEAAFTQVPNLDKSQIRTVDGFSGVFIPSGKNNIPKINDFALPY